MCIKGGVLVIGSLLWDVVEKPIRKEWQTGLLMSGKKLIPLPIRYGRASSSRSNTYSMVFSNQIIGDKTLGKGYLIPFRASIDSEEEFEIQVSRLSRAEGFEKVNEGLIYRSWGTVCIAVNPYINEEKANKIEAMWKKLVDKKNNALIKGQQKPRIDDFGEPYEKKSIDANLKLTIPMEALFKNQLRELDFVLATSNAIKRRDKKIHYPKTKEIALAMYQAKDYSYFLKNGQVYITTFQDKIVAKILRKKFKVSFKKEHRKYKLSN